MVGNTRCNNSTNISRSYLRILIEQHLNQPLTGHVAPTTVYQGEKRPMYKKSTNQQLDVDTTRNIKSENYYWS